MNHIKFIKSPIEKILLDMSLSTSCIEHDIALFLLSEYITQSTLLRMTGHQEQKMKCIMWEIATRDYEYRYNRFTKGGIGECSSYSDKNSIYQDLSNQIEILSGKREIPDDKYKINLLNQTNLIIEDAFSKSFLKSFYSEKFKEYQVIWSGINPTYFLMETKELFTKNLQTKTKSRVKHNNSVKPVTIFDIYNNYLYRERNRLAHNTLSYQGNLPNLDSFTRGDAIYNNYFLYFSILVLIDKIFIQMFDEYLDILDR